MANILGILITVGVVLVSMMLHELAHGFTAYKLGDDTAKNDGRLTLNPLKHLDPFLSIVLPLLLIISGGPVFGGAKPVPVNSRNLKHGAWGMALVAIAGPLMNFILAFLGFLVGHLSGALYEGGVFGEIIVTFISVNLGFGVFNLIPISPLDGSRVLYAISPDVVREGLERIEPFGMMIVMVLVVFGQGIVSNVMMTVIEGVLRGFYFLVGVV